MQATARLERQLRSRSRFLASLSHELRAPLNGIIGFADLLASGTLPPDSPRRAAFLGHIQASGRHLLQLVEDVVELARVDAGQVEFQPEPVDVAALVARVVDVLHTRFMRRGLSVDCDVEPSVATIHVDPVALKQALAHYLGNAVLRAPEGSRIQVRATPRDPGRFLLEVEDGGPAIAPEVCAGAFDEFGAAAGAAGAADPARDTGLGLALTRRLVQAQGGWVGVRSVPGAATAFFLVLDRDQRPAAAPDCTHEPALAEPVDASPSQAPEGVRPR